VTKTDGIQDCGDVSRVSTVLGMNLIGWNSDSTKLLGESPFEDGQHAEGLGRELVRFFNWRRRLLVDAWNVR